MPETNAQEPTMEEILASIRRIISEDDGAQPAPAAAAHEPAYHDDEVLELTDKIEPAPVVAPEPAPGATDTVGDLDIFHRPEPASHEPERHEPPRSEPTPAPAPRPEPRRPMFESSRSASEGNLVSDHAAQTAAAHFGQLARSIAMPAPTVTLDDVVREMLKPLLRDWLDQNLTGIVEAKVQAEVERIARQQR